MSIVGKVDNAALSLLFFHIACVEEHKRKIFTVYRPCLLFKPNITIRKGCFLNE